MQTLAAIPVFIMNIVYNLGSGPQFTYPKLTLVKDSFRVGPSTIHYATLQPI